MNDCPPQIVPVLDWHGLWAGYVSYDAAGNYFPQDLPRGIRLAVQPAELSEPVMRTDKRWEAWTIHYPNTVIKEGDTYRLWYGCFADPEDPWIKAGNVPGKLAGLYCYAESKDAFRWERPALGLFEFDGSRENNILFPCLDAGNHYGYTSIMRDPNGPDEERYKGICFTGKFWINGRPASRNEVMDLRARRDAAGDGGAISAEITSRMVITGGVSPDGLHWTHLEQPIMDTPWLLDTQNILTYDESAGKYVIYLRSHLKRRRAVSRYEAPDFRGPWTNHRMVLAAEPDDPPSWDIYTPCYCKHPSGGHLMFYTAYDRASDLIQAYLATSHDGQLWFRPERKPIIPATERYGTLYPSPEIVPIGGDTWGVIVLACPHPHNVDTRPGTMRSHEYLWAMWKRGRFVAWQADDWAEFATTEHECAGQQLTLNVKTRQPGAFVKVEIVEGDLPNRTGATLIPALKSHSFADCDPLCGDYLDAVVTWKGKSDLSSLRGKKIHLRFQMARASLFAFTL